MKVYDYKCEIILEKNIKAAKKSIIRWKEINNQTKKMLKMTVDNIKFWEDCLTQLESAIKRLKEEL